MENGHRLKNKLYERDYGAEEFDSSHLTGDDTIETEPTPELEPKPKVWQYVLLLISLVGALWLSDIFGFTIPGFLDDLIYDTIIALIYSYFGYKVTFPKRKN